MPKEDAGDVGRVSHQFSNDKVEDPWKFNDVSPKPILPEKEAEIFINNEESNQYPKKLSTYMPKITCCKCNKEIKCEKMLKAGYCPKLQKNGTLQMQHY